MRIFGYVIYNPQQWEEKITKEKDRIIRELERLKFMGRMLAALRTAYPFLRSEKLNHPDVSALSDLVVEIESILNRKENNEEGN